jgi:CheY-like chemotaxis protein
VSVIAFGALRLKLHHVVAGVVLALAGHEVRVVNDGRSAAGAAGEFDAQVVLLDIGLPDIDGYTVARELRSLPKGKQLLLLAVSGYGRDEDLRKSRAAGIDAHFTKPIDPDALGAVIAEGWP